MGSDNQGRARVQNAADVWSGVRRRVAGGGAERSGGCVVTVGAGAAGQDGYRVGVGSFGRAGAAVQVAGQSLARRNRGAVDEVGAGVVRASMRVQGGRWWLSCSLSVERGRAVRHGVFRSGAEAGGSADDGGRVGLGSAGKNVKASQGGELAHPADDLLWPLLLWPVLLWSVLWCSVVGLNSPD